MEIGPATKGEILSRISVLRTHSPPSFRVRIPRLGVVSFCNEANPRRAGPNVVSIPWFQYGIGSVQSTPHRLFYIYTVYLVVPIWNCVRPIHDDTGNVVFIPCVSWFQCGIPVQSTPHTTPVILYLYRVWFQCGIDVSVLRPLPLAFLLIVIWF